MPVITALTLQKNKKLTNLFVDNKFVCGLKLDLILSQKLKVGKQLSPTELKLLIDKSIYSKLLSASLHFLSYRPRSEKETRNYLINKSVKNTGHKKKSAVIEQVLEKLKSQKLIDDHEFASWWIEQRLKFRPKGKFILKKELQFKGIDPEIIEELLNTESEIEAARTVIIKKSRLLNRLAPQNKKQKTVNLLLQRGFSWETIKCIVDEEGL